MGAVASSTMNKVARSNSRFNKRVSGQAEQVCPGAGVAAASLVA